MQTGVVVALSDVMVLFGQEQDCQLTRDIVDLVNQEVDLISRRVRSHNLHGLRKRICILFLQYIKTPAFNPNVAKLLKVRAAPGRGHGLT